LPRHLNGIPDSEFEALYNLLIQLELSDGFNPDKKVLIETGCGASTIILLYFSIRWNVQLYSWDISGDKVSYLRGILNDTLFRYFYNLNIFAHWKYVAFSSVSKFAGITILKELNKEVIFSFFDSDHTWTNLHKELNELCMVISDKSIVCIDDANYHYEFYNTAYIDMVRTKLGLSCSIIENNDMRESFAEKTELFLVNNFSNVMNLKGGTYPANCLNDLFWSYYQSDRENMETLGMEKMHALRDRFAAWSVVK